MSGQNYSHYKEILEQLESGEFNKWAEGYCEDLQAETIPNDYVAIVNIVKDFVSCRLDEADEN